MTIIFSQIHAKKILPPKGTGFNITVNSIDLILPNGKNLTTELTKAVRSIANIPGINISQNSEGIVEVTISPELSISVIPVGDFVQGDPPADGKPQISVDQRKGIVTLTTPSGVRVNFAPAPQSITGLNNELRRVGVDLGQVHTEFFEDRMEMRIGDIKLSLKPDFVVRQTGQPSGGISGDAQGNTVITYEGGKQQVFFPYIVNYIELEDAMKPIAGVKRMQVGFDGIIELTFQGVGFKFRPDYLISTAPPGTQAGFEVLDQNSVRITFKDGTSRWLG